MATAAFAATHAATTPVHVEENATSVDLPVIQDSCLRAPPDGPAATCRCLASPPRSCERP